MQLDLDPQALVGQLIVGGFDGETLPGSFARELSAGRRGGAILFKRNLPSVEAAHALCTAIARGTPPDLPPFVGVDQEGGRVRRLGPPAIELPPMRELARLGDPALVERAAAAVARELGAIGFSINFAPVLDVNTEADNPVIGDRAFGSDPSTVARFGVAYLNGLQGGGLSACGKHFPGHGDTRIDSHLALPTIPHDRARLDAIDLPPFRAAISAGIDALMSAHIVCERIDPGVPATLSPAICTALLRGELAFSGVLFSDDLEMKAISARGQIEDAAVGAVRAGCDVVLICRDEHAQARAHEALVREAERDAAFRRRCTEAASRGVALRRRRPPRPAPTTEALWTAFDTNTNADLTDQIGAKKR